MEVHERTLSAGAARRAGPLAAVLAACLCLGGGRADAQALNQRIPGLFGGELNTTIASGISGGQPLQFSDQFRSLSAVLAAARSQAPIPSASGAFRFEWDDELDTFVRSTQSLGSGLAERAQTLGARTGTVSMSYTRIDFDSSEGTPLDNLVFRQPAISPALLATLPPSDQARYGGDKLRTRLNLQLAMDIFYLTAAYGVTDSIDLSVALSVNHAHMAATAQTQIQSGNADTPPGKETGNAIFLLDQAGHLSGPGGRLCSPGTTRCAVDSFDDSATGTGDVFLRGKWHIADTRYADLALAGVLTVPTGNADNFLGFNDPTFTPWIIASKSFGRLSPHLNVGYAFRSGKDVSQAQWIAGADLLAFRWLTLNADFLGYHDDHRDGINDDVLQSAVGFKVNPFGHFVVAGTFQFPLNRDGLRADVIYTGQLEYTF